VLASHLPGLMVPRELVRIEALPVNGNEKTGYRTLREWDTRHEISGTEWCSGREHDPSFAGAGDEGP
jgi:hypothetical protein